MASYGMNDVKNGMKILVNNEPSIISDTEYVKPGKGQAFTRVKYRLIKDGRTQEVTMKSTDSLDAADVVDVGDDPLSDLAGYRSDQGRATGRHVLHLAGILIAVGQHEAAEHVDLDALEPPTFWLGKSARTRRRRSREGCHAAFHWSAKRGRSVRNATHPTLRLGLVVGSTDVLSRPDRLRSPGNDGRSAPAACAARDDGGRR